MADTLFYIGVLQLTVVFLSIAAGIIAASLYRVSHVNKELRAWKLMIIALVLFAVVEIIGVLDAFNIMRSINYLRHIIPSLIMAFLIGAILRQIEVVKEKRWS